MTGARYLIVLPTDHAHRQWHDRALEIAGQQGLDLAVGQGFLLLSSERPMLIGGAPSWRGAVVGTMFPRGGGMAFKTIADDIARAAIATNGGSLIERCWGDYVAIIVRDNSRSVLRAPFGDLPCYVCRSAGATLFASDIALLESASVKPAIDWRAVALQLIAQDIRRRHTCLTGIDELGCGERVTVGPALDYQPLWSPWRFVGPDERPDDRVIAAERLRDVLLGTIAAQTSDGIANTLLLSGGVDSSVAAAALAAAGRGTSALTMVTQDAAGDERAHARAVAAHCDIPLVEIVRDPAMIDLSRSDAHGLPYPTETAFSQATRSAISTAPGLSGRRVLHGGGGDQIFCSLQSAAPLADLIRARGFDRRIPRLTLDLAEVAHTTAAAVARQALSRLIGRRSTYRWPANIECLTPLACSYEAEALHHPWLSPPPGVGSGSAGHVALTMSALGIVQSPAWQARPPWKAILLSQPVIETCLSIPSWLWFERGCNRAIARRAVEDLLPPGHVWRRGKGAMASFMIEIFDANRPLLRSMIGDGALVREGLVDRAACLKILDAPPPVRGTGWARLLQIADVEAWAASW
jgi:asparagine synthase (glutamine-hydrolysing)